MRIQTGLFLTVIACLGTVSRAEIANCVEYSSTDPSLCLKCGPGFGVDFKDGQKSCVACPANCDDCSRSADDKLECSKCAVNYYSYKTGSSEIACFLCGDGCEGGCQDGIGCSQCKANYFLYKPSVRQAGGTTCLTCPQGCLQCTDLKGCEVCDNTFWFRSQTLERTGDCIECGPYCLECSDNDGCTKCQPETFVAAFTKNPANKDGHCKDCDQNCDKCEDFIGCANCKANYFAAKKSTSAKFKTCNSCPNKCASCETDLGCSKCETGFFPRKLQEDDLYPTECAACIANCQTCSGLTTCDKCDSGYHVEPVANSAGLFSCLPDTKDEPSFKRFIAGSIILAALIVLGVGAYLAFRCSKRTQASNYHHDSDTSLTQ